eukprot:13062935-Alexandrium_andersonii.AAC.1
MGLGNSLTNQSAPRIRAGCARLPPPELLNSAGAPQACLRTGGNQRGAGTGGRGRREGPSRRGDRRSRPRCRSTARGTRSRPGSG